MFARPSYTKRTTDLSTMATVKVLLRLLYFSVPSFLVTVGERNGSFYPPWKMRETLFSTVDDTNGIHHYHNEGRTTSLIWRKDTETRILPWVAGRNHESYHERRGGPCTLPCVEGWQDLRSLPRTEEARGGVSSRWAACWGSGVALSGSSLI